MFEAQLEQSDVLKKLVDAIKELVSEVNLDCDQTGISLQAMDSAHVSLVSMKLESQGFEHYRADRSMSLGINMSALATVLKCANKDDQLTFKSADDADTVTFLFESKRSDRISDFSLKLMDIDSEHLGIPEQQYACAVSLPSSEFQRICRELATFGDTVSIHATKDGIKFKVEGDMGTGNITLRPGAGGVKRTNGKKKKPAKKKKKTTKKKVKKEKDGVTVKDEDAMDEDDDEEDSDEEDSDDMEESSDDDDDDEGKEGGVKIALEDDVKLTFALRYLNFFAKATPLSATVGLSMSPDVPLMVEYKMEGLGHLRFYLAPKIDD